MPAALCVPRSAIRSRTLQPAALRAHAAAGLDRFPNVDCPLLDRADGDRLDGRTPGADAFGARRCGGDLRCALRRRLRRRPQHGTRTAWSRDAGLVIRGAVARGRHPGGRARRALRHAPLRPAPAARDRRRTRGRCRYEFMLLPGEDAEQMSRLVRSRHCSRRFATCEAQLERCTVYTFHALPPPAGGQVRCSWPGTPRT